MKKFLSLLLGAALLLSLCSTAGADAPIRWLTGRA